MRAINKSLIGIAGSVLLAGAAWAANTPPPNPTASDSDHNTAGGSGALGLLDSPSHVNLDNTAFGYNAGGGLNNGGDRNTLVGSQSMPQSVSGAVSNNTAVGYNTLNANTGDGNTAIGSMVMPYNTTGANNVGLGFAALLNNATANNNVAIGANALENVTDGSGNSAVGYQALFFNGSGAANTAVGIGAAGGITDGSYNTATGSYALYNNQSGLYNIAIGYQALYNSTASNNNAVGAYAMFDNTTGSNNNAQGINAMQHNTTGSNNVAVGSGALKNNLISNSNTAIGSQALLKSTGSSNIAIGSGAGFNLTSGSNNIYLANQGLPSETGVIRIGAGAQTKAFIAGIAGSSVTNATAVQVNTATGQLGVLSSSARYKNDIAELAGADLKLAQLRPVHFTYKADATHAKHYGLIAEDVAKVYPEIVTHNAQGEVETLDYQALIPLLLKQVQVQQADNARQQAEIAELRAQLQKLSVAAGSAAVH